MSDVVIAFFVPTIVFLVIVAPLWILMHYRSKQRARSELSAEERQLLELPPGRAKRMAGESRRWNRSSTMRLPGGARDCRRRNTRRWGRERQSKRCARRVSALRGAA